MPFFHFIIYCVDSYFMSQLSSHFSFCQLTQLPLPTNLDGEREELAAALRSCLEEGQAQDLLMQVQRHVATQLLGVVCQNLKIRKGDNKCNHCVSPISCWVPFRSRHSVLRQLGLVEKSKVLQVTLQHVEPNRICHRWLRDYLRGIQEKSMRRTLGQSQTKNVLGLCNFPAALRQKLFWTLHSNKSRSTFFIILAGLPPQKVKGDSTENLGEIRTISSLCWV